MTRIGTYASDLMNLYQVSQIHQTVNNLTNELTSQVKSTDYTGIASSAEQYLNFNNEKSSITNFQQSNTLLNTTMQAMTTSYTGLQTTMTDFQNALQTFTSTGVNTTQSYTDLQNNAFNALKNMAFYLNQSVGGQYIFSGSKTDTPPVNFPYGTLADFQNAFNGYSVNVPTSRAADLSNVTTNVLDTGTFTLNDQTGTITAQRVGQFSKIAIGSTVTLSGGPQSGARYTVFGNDGTNLTIDRSLVDEGAGQNQSSAKMTDATGTAINTGSLQFTGPNVITAETAVAPVSQIFAATTNSSAQLVNLTTASGTSLGFTDGDTFVMADTGTGANAVTFTVGAPLNTAAGNGGGSSLSDLTSWIAAQTTGDAANAAAGGITLSMVGGAPTLTTTGNQNVTVSGTVAEHFGLVAANGNLLAGGSVATGPVSVNTQTINPAPVNNTQLLTGLVDANGATLNIKTNDTFTVTSGAQTSTFTVGAARSVVSGNGGGATIADFAAWLSAQNIGTMSGANLSLGIGSTNGGTLAVNNAGSLVADDVTLGGNMAADLGFAGASGTADHNGGASGITAANVNVTAPFANAFQNLKVGDSFTVSGATNAANNGSFIVAGKDLTNASLTIQRIDLSTQANVTADTNDAAALVTIGNTNYGANGAVNTGNLTFTSTNTIVANTGGTLSTIPVGGFITVSGATVAANNGTYVVTGNNGTSLSVAAITQTSLTDEAANTGAGISNGSPTVIAPNSLAFFSGGSTAIAGASGTLSVLQPGQTVNISGTKSNNGSLVVTATFPGAVTSEVETPTLVAGADTQAVITNPTTTFGPALAGVNTGTLTFTAPNTLTAATGGSLAALTVGSRITIGNALNPTNDGAYVVTANNGTTMQLALPTQLVVNSGSSLSPDHPVTFNASGTTPNLTGSSSDLGSLKAGDVINVSGTMSNNTGFVVSGPPVANLTDDLVGTTGVTFTSGATVVNTGADNTQFFAGNGVIMTGATSLAAFVSGQSVTVAGDAQAGNNAAQTVSKVFNDSLTPEAGAISVSLTQNDSATPLTINGTLSVNAGAGTLTSTVPADFAGLNVGDVVNFGSSGTSTNLGKSFVVQQIVGGILTFAPAGDAMRVSDLKVPLAPPNTAVELAKNTSISNSTYYQGNAGTQVQQVDTNRSMSFGVTAMDPAFEKAIRAMQMIAQGKLGTAGGLDLNRDRLGTATDLLYSAVSQDAPPSSTELSGNILSLQNTLAVQQKDLTDIGTQQSTYLTYVQGMSDSLIGIDQQTVIEDLMNQQQALQASYQAMASVRQLSLLTYLK